MKLKELRLQSKKTQADIANYLKMSTTGYNGYEKENREPNIETLIKLADFYNVTLDYLVGRDFTSPIGYLTENQIDFLKTFLALNIDNQMNAVIFVGNLLANQK